MPPKTTAIPWDEPTGPQPIEKKDAGLSEAQETDSQASDSQAQLPALTEKTRGSPLAKIIVALLSLLLLAGLVFLSMKAPMIASLRSKHANASSPLSLVDVTSERRFENGAMQLVVDGKIMNETDKNQNIPPIEASAIGPNGKNIHQWMIEPSAPSIDPQTSLPFHSVITTPDGSIAAVNLKFGVVSDDAKPH